MIFGMSIGRWLLILLLLFLAVKRADMVAIYARICYSRRDFVHALKGFRLADKIGSLNANNKKMLGYCCLRAGELNEARMQLNLALGMLPRGNKERNQVRNLIALLCWKEGNLQEGIEILEEILESGYENTLIYQNLGILHNLSDNKQKALEFNQKAYEYNSDDNIICDNLADSYARLQMWEQAEKQYEELLAKNPPPRFPEAYYGYGKVLIQLGKKEEGLAMIEQSLDKPFSYMSIRSKEEIEELYRSLGGEA